MVKKSDFEAKNGHSIRSSANRALNAHSLAKNHFGTYIRLGIITIYVHELSCLVHIYFHFYGIFLNDKHVYVSILVTEIFT